jgi:hypothetical protein
MERVFPEECSALTWKGQQLQEPAFSLCIVAEDLLGLAELYDVSVGPGGELEDAKFSPGKYQVQDVTVVLATGIEVKIGHGLGLRGGRELSAHASAGGCRPVAAARTCTRHF